MKHGLIVGYTNYNSRTAHFTTIRLAYNHRTYTSSGHKQTKTAQKLNWHEPDDESQI